MAMASTIFMGLNNYVSDASPLCLIIINIYNDCFLVALSFQSFLRYGFFYSNYLVVVLWKMCGIGF
jgi:hypothetical protein